MTSILVRFFLPPHVLENPRAHYLALDDVAAVWNGERQKERQRRVLVSVVIGSIELPPRRNDKGVVVAIIAEVRAQVGVDHGRIGVNVEACRDELAALAALFDAELEKRSLVPAFSSEITVGFSV